MNRLNGPELLELVLDFLDALIEEQGHLLYMVLVYVSLPLIAWILSGGLRRKPSPRQRATIVSIIVICPPGRPPPLPPSSVMAKSAGHGHGTTMIVHRSSRESMSDALCREQETGQPPSHSKSGLD